MGSRFLGRCVVLGPCVNDRVGQQFGATRQRGRFGRSAGRSTGLNLMVGLGSDGGPRPRNRVTRVQIHADSPAPGNEKEGDRTLGCSSTAGNFT